jgi:hypothetical protein
MEKHTKEYRQILNAKKPVNEIVKYPAEGLENFQVRIDEDTVWLTIEQMCVLFDKSRATINEHILNVFKEKELEKEEVVRKIGNSDFSQNVTKPTNYYSLDVIISVGYRVKSQRGTQFRQWATSVLRDYLLKGASVQHPASKKELEDMETRLSRQLDEIRQDIEEKPRRRIGFKTNYE